MVITSASNHMPGAEDPGRRHLTTSDNSTRLPFIKVSLKTTNIDISDHSSSKTKKSM